MAWLIFAALGGGAFLIAACFSRTALSAGLGHGVDARRLCARRDPWSLPRRLAWLNPWHHYFPQAVVAAGQIDPVGVAVLLAWTAGGIAAAVWVFGRRDLA